MTDNPVKIKNLESLIEDSKKGFPLNSKYILELPIFNPENGFPFLREYLNERQDACAKSLKPQTETSSSAGAYLILELIQKYSPDILGLKFNIENANGISKAVEIFKNIEQSSITLPLMIRGSGNDEIDRELLQKLAKAASKTSIIASANENTFKDIIPYTRDKHYIVLKSPIDINIAKEINILSSELGQPLDKIIIDTDIGGLGYGFEYGYSIIEKIKQEAQNDRYLNMPVISFAGEEALKTKEAKSKDFSKSWGKLKDRRVLLEITAASAIRAAGANLIVINMPQTLITLKGLK